MECAQNENEEKAYTQQRCHPENRAAQARKMLDSGGALGIVGSLGDELSV
jgi:hypothetical protein